MRLLHLSDLHARTASDKDQTEIVEATLDDLTKMHRERAIDLVVFSGDLAFDGTSAAFDRGRVLLLDALAERLPADVHASSYPATTTSTGAHRWGRRSRPSPNARQQRGHQRAVSEPAGVCTSHGTSGRLERLPLRLLRRTRCSETCRHGARTPLRSGRDERGSGSLEHGLAREWRCR